MHTIHSCTHYPRATPSSVCSESPLPPGKPSPLTSSLSHPSWFLLYILELEAPRASIRCKHLAKLQNSQTKNHTKDPRGRMGSFLLRFPPASLRLPPPSPDKEAPSPVQIDCFIDCLHTDAFRKGCGLAPGGDSTPPPPGPTLVLRFTDGVSPHTPNPPPQPRRFFAGTKTRLARPSRRAAFPLPIPPARPPASLHYT